MARYESSRWWPRYAGAAAAVLGGSVFAIMALVGQPVAGLAVAVPLGGFTWLVWHRGGIGHRLRNRILHKH